MVMVKNIKDFEKHLNDYLKCDERYKNVEIDFEKFDKSQLIDGFLGIIGYGRIFIIYLEGESF